MLRLLACQVLLLSSAWGVVHTQAAKAQSAPAGKGAVQAVFATKAEAEAAAPRFGCNGAHRMGHQWMPCSSHAETTGGTHSSMGHK
ncbi:DUF3721 domain-containing protein [Synechococcus sp. CS-602]|uniref:DUF3721 domain-containing protein n=1 Tax=Synechococcaceae TaxID=1890426 RepID=UPI0008FF4E01|nr:MULTISPECIES: DUF3721 domain-containing protein [Synechococcaceae]MCT4364017.1 DUF3721 domain-containing protein [Candidatus Regnicoccus frigidus MAG-AL1]MCT0204880.1 DUF3721 domain-containing protein [Synechococcus sp. CS-602]MCT0245837.1 DUF3721 domain-containing protein [Synechococcus sp. CS-601]MCT4368734.1 DUF3721 domain-containing protein [Candidatus Regnicoccus frigidus MAG-AL2]TWB87903.1 uncharacterized protein DUF3721 [Synechococcus sp. Ace-Pa]